MSRLLRPGMWLLNQLRYPQKFIVMSLLIAIPLILTLLVLFSETQPQIEFTARELAGSRYIGELISIADLVRKTHDPKYQVTAAADHDAIDLVLSKLRSDQTSTALFATTQPLDRIAQLHTAIRRHSSEVDHDAIDEAYSELIEALASEIQRVTDASNLVLDPELTTYYLINLGMIHTPDQIQLLVESHHLSESGHSSLGLPIRAELIAIAGQLEASAEATRHALEIANSSDATLDATLTAQLSDALTNLTGLSNILRATEEAKPANLKQTTELTNNALESSIRLSRTAIKALDIRLEQRVQRLNQKNMLAIGISGILFAVLAYLFAGFYLATMRAISVLDQASQRPELSQHGQEITLNTRDELGQITAAFNRLIRALSEESTERQVAVAEQARLQETIIQSQLATLDELSVPLIPLSAEVALLPLIGTIDTQRAQHIVKTLLDGVAQHRARIVIIDLSGIRIVDSQVAQTLVQAATGTKLLGAEVALAGLRADVAQTVAHLGVDFGTITFYATLQEALTAHLTLE